MTSLIEVVQQKAAALKTYLSIPPFSESMAGVLILFVFTNGVATSVWMFNTWSPFIFILFWRSNLYVGLVSAVNGVFEVSTAFVSGYVADKLIGPSRTLQGAVYIGLVTLVIVMFGIWSEKLWMLVLAQCFEGTYMGFSFTCLESTFAQCLRRGERDRLYSVKFSCESAGPIVGLILTAVILVTVGDTWTIPVLRWVMTVGLIMHFGSMVTFMYLFRPIPWTKSASDNTEAGAREAQEVVIETITDDAGKLAPGVLWTPTMKPLGAGYDVEGTGINEEMDLSEINLLPEPSTEIANCTLTTLMQGGGEAPSPVTPSEPSSRAARDTDCVNVKGGEQCSRKTSGVAAEEGRTSVPAACQDPRKEDGVGELERGGVSAEIQQGAVEYYVDAEFDEATGLRRTVMEWIPLKWYPLIVVIADVIMTIGSGMTTQYFSLFMMSVYDVSPATVAMLNLFTALIVVIMAIVGGSLGKRYGRVRALLPPKYVSASILLWMALTRGTKYAPTALMCIAYVLRGSLMNCSAGLSRALIMDLVPEGRRGRWNAVESIQSAGWSGSAILGGYLADRLGYGAAFIFTFFFHLTSCMMLTPLMVRNDSRLPQLVVVAPAASEETNSKELSSTS